MAQQRTNAGSTQARLTRLMEPYRQAWLKSERARHEEFIQALRDPCRSQDVLDAASQELQDWRAQDSRPVAEIEGWQAILALPADAVATLLEEQSHPLLERATHGNPGSPFTRPSTVEEIEASRQEVLDRLLHRGKFASTGRQHTDKCNVSLVRFAGLTYRVLMADSDFSHPGELVRQQCLERFELTVTDGARVLGVSRQALTNLITGKAGISPEMALRLDLAFGGGAETWLQRQLLHDLAQARRRLAELNVVPVASERQPALF
jgi:addiction module HigA family antidote